MAGTPDEDERAQEQEAALLLELGEAMHWVAMPADLVERRLRGVARGLGTRAQVFVLQGFLCVQVGRDVVGRVALRVTSFDTHWNLQRLSRLVELSRSVTAGATGLVEARAELARILAAPRPYVRPLVVLAYAVYGAAVAVRIGGRWWEALAGGLIGVLAGWIHFGTIRFQRVDLQKSFLAALGGALTGLLLSLVLPPFDLSRAIFGGIALLVPAMVVTVGVHEMANDALESGVVRLSYGLLRFLMLAFGIAAMARLWMTFLALPAPLSVTPLPHAVVLILVGIGGAALTMCLQGRLRDLPWIAGAALLAYGTQELTKLVVGGRGSPLVAAFVLGAVGALHARLPGRIAGTVVIPGLLQLAPGFLGAEAVLNLLGQHVREETFFDVLLTALQLVTGLLVAELLFSRRRAEE